MRFGLFYEHQLPRPWRTGGEAQLLADALEQIELADRLGSIASGWSSITSSRSTPTRRHPRCSSVPPASAPSRSGWATASSISRSR